MQYGIVRRFDPVTQTIDVQLDGTNDDCVCLGVPVICQGGPSANVVAAGTRCVLAQVGGDWACLGYGQPMGAGAEAERSAINDAPGDVRQGTPDAAMLLLNQQGIASLQAAPGTAIMLHGPSRTVNLVGENLATSTPTVNSAVTSDELGNPLIELSIYNALGRILEYSYNGALNISSLSVDRLLENNVQVGGSPEEGGIPIVDSHITVHTPEGPLNIDYNSLAPGIGIQISFPGRVVLNAGSAEIQAAAITMSAAQLNINSPIVRFNGAPPTPANAVVKGSLLAPAQGSPLLASPNAAQGLSTSVFAL